MRYTSAMRTLFLTTVISVAFAQAPSEPTDVQGWIRHGLEAVKAGRHDDALKAMDRALQIDPNNLHALHTLAFLQFNRDMLTEARATYERILGITPDGKEAHYGLAAVLSKNIESKRKEARAQSNLAPDAPGPIPLPSARGQYQAEAAPMIDDATRHLDQVLLKDPTFVPAIAYMNQLIRARADYAADATGYQQEIAKAEEWAAKMQAARSSVSSPAPASGSGPAQIRVGAEVQKAKLVRRIEPVYPPMALQARIQGVVRFNVVIGEDGRVVNPTVVSGHPLLVPAATEAIKQWEYSQTLLNGKPTEVITQADVNFVLNQ